MASTSSSTRINPPGSSDPSLVDGPGGFDRKWFMGTWGVAWSTLPMWNDKRDVRITYEPIQGEGEDYKKFDSTVSSHKRSAGPESKASTVSGSETLTPGTNGATFDWRGKGWLFFVSSHWEVLGYGKDGSSNLEWAVTFFSKTLFTPAGIDIYIRSVPSTSSQQAQTSDGGGSEQQRQEMLDSVVRALQAREGTVGEMAKKGFQVPGVV